VCAHPDGHQSAMLRYSAAGRLQAWMVCDDCGERVRPLIAQTLAARHQQPERRAPAQSTANR
jgi:hypothetical protein